MSQSAAESRASDARTIGDILLERGFVTGEVLDEALARQQTSGKPLGQILVEDGAISRLELASALAEQWSDIGSVSPEFGIGSATSGGETPLLELEELRYSKRMLEERLRAWEKAPPAQQDPGEHDRLVERLAGVEAAVASLQEHDEAHEIGRLGEAVGEIERRLEQTSDAISSLADQQQSSERIDDVDRRLAALGTAVERAFQEMERRADESRDALAEVTGTVGGLTRAIGERPDHADDLAELRRRVDALAGDSAVVAALQERAASLEERFERRAAAFESRFQELFAQSHEPGELTESVDELARRVDALASRPVAEEDADARIAELGVRVEHLATALDSLGDRQTDSTEFTARLDGIARAVADLESRPAADPGLAARIDTIAAQVGELAARPHPREDLDRAVAELGARVDELGQQEDAARRLESLSGRIDALEQRPSLEPGVASLSERADRLERTGVELTARVEELTELAHRADDGVAAAAPSDAVARLESLEQGVGGLAGQLRGVEETTSALDTRLDALSARIEDASARGGTTSVSDTSAGHSASRGQGDVEDVERLRLMVERLMHDFAEHRRAVSSALSSREFTALLEELAARVDELQAGGVPAAPAGGDGERPAAGRPDVRALTRRLDEVEESVRSSRDGVFQRLERMMGTIDWRLQRLEHPEEAQD